MVLRGWRAGVAIVVGTVLVGGVVFFALDVLPGLRLAAAAGLLPRWAVHAAISHTVVSLTAKTKTADVEAIVATLERFAASHGFVRDADGAVMVKGADPDHLRLSYTGPRASLSFYTESGVAVLAVESEPGREDDLSGWVGMFGRLLGRLGLRIRDSFGV